jgi:transposase-like protein
MSQKGNLTGGRTRSGYTEDFKRSVVDHWCHGQKTAEQVAKEFGVKVWNVRDWRRQYGPTHKPIDAPMPETPEELRRELQQLRKELAVSPPSGTF